MVLPTLLALAALAAPPPAGDPGSARPVRHWDLRDGHLRVAVDPATGDVLDGHVTWHVDPAGVPHDRLTLHATGLAIASVAVDGEAVTARHGAGLLDIPVAPGVPHTIDIRWTATPEVGLHGREPVRGARGAVVWTQGENEDHRHWFPGWDHPSDMFTLTTSVTVPDAAHAVANGVLQDKAPADDRPGWTTWTYRLDQPMVTYLVALVAGDIAVETLDGPVPHEILFPVDVPREAAVRSAGASPAMMTFFADLLDEPYPYPVYRQAIVPRFMYGGMENASLTILTDRYVDGGTDLFRFREDGLIAHELAHQWFGDLLTCHGWQELWLNEGFATYYAGRWAEHAEGAESYADKVLGWLAQAVTTNGPMSSRPWADGGGWTGIYPRGAFVLHMLRQHLGTDRFDAAIARYVEAHRFDLVETADLRQVMEDAAAQDLRWFFDRWVHGWGATALTSRWRHADGQLRLTIRQEGEAPYRGPITVLWADAAGDVHTLDATLSDGATEITAAAESVAWVVPDPDGRVIARWTRHQDAAAWAATLRAAPDPIARLLAVDALGAVEDGQDVAATALAEALVRLHRVGAPTDPGADRFAQAVRAAAALGALGTDAARNALIAQIEDPHILVRDAVLAALGDFPLDDTVERALLRVVRGAEVPALRGTALASLARVRPSTAALEARVVLARPDRDPQGALHVAAVDTLGAHGAVGDSRLLLPVLDDRRRELSHSAAAALAAIAARAEDDGLTDRVAARLVPWLTHEDVRTRQFVVGVLGRLGSEAAVPGLRAVADTRLDGLGDAIRAALRAIRAARPSDDPDALAEATAAIKALEEKLDALDKRLREVEQP